MHTVTKFRIWEYCWLTTKVCRRLFHVDSIIVRTFCHSSVYNFFLWYAHQHFVLLFTAFWRRTENLLIVEDFGFHANVFWTFTLKIKENLQVVLNVAFFFVWIVVGGEFIFRHKSGSWKLTLPAWRLGSLLCPIWPTFALFRTGRTPVGRGWLWTPERGMKLV